MSEHVDTLIDHAAEMQCQLDELDRELFVLAVAVVMLATIVTALAVRQLRG